MSVDTLHSREICEDTLFNLDCRNSEPEYFTRAVGVAAADSAVRWQRHRLLLCIFALDNAHGVAARLLDPFLSVTSWLSCFAFSELQSECFGVRRRAKGTSS